MVEDFLDIKPDTKKALFIAWNAHINGDVILGKDVSVWYGTTLRGDTGPIRVGDKTNIQDGSVVHNSTGTAVNIGSQVTIGHGAIVHGCTVGDNCLIGMGAIILDNAEIGENSIVAAGSLVTQGKKFPPGSMIMGSPAKVVRSLTPEDIESNKGFCERNIKHAREAAQTLSEMTEKLGTNPWFSKFFGQSAD